uniref:SSD domain-containing protein n=1 Tax=Heterorhabditis bacteriophora TaxID=37862 RepID=A0A1I7XEC2_HETBA
MVLRQYFTPEEEQLIRELYYHSTIEELDEELYGRKETYSDRLQGFVERRLIGNSDSADFSDAWKIKFSHTPTWCDADMALQQINRGGRLNEELSFLSRVQAESNRLTKRTTATMPIEPSERKGPELPRENGLGGGFQVVIQTPTFEGENILSKKALLKHVELMEEIANYEVELHGEKWTLNDICFKPPGPNFNSGPLSKVMNTLLDKIIPCIWISPIDCYWEGSKPLGPNPPLNLGGIWLVIKLKRGLIKKIFITVLSITCYIGKKRRKRQAMKAPKKDEDYYAYEDDSDYDVSEIGNGTSGITKAKKEPKDTACLEYGTSLLSWMQANPDRLGEFLTQKEMPRYPDYGEIMTGGCKGFGRNIMEWPEDLIIGGIERRGKKLQSAEALQSVFLVASPFDVFLRFKKKGDIHPNLDTHQWNPAWAEEVIVAWQRNFTKKLYGHKANVEGIRVFHPLASTSIADMLEEFSQFNYTIIFMGYVLMVIYAAFTQARIDGRWLAIKSNVALSFVGVVLVTYSSICGLGVTTAMGINFNAATTQVRHTHQNIQKVVFENNEFSKNILQKTFQIVPFLSLGLGIDDMFLLLHNYDEIIHTVNKNEMGMSVMVTSINNILAFCAGYVLPIPALRSFCSQTAILLAFNLASLMFIFPAFIGLDLRRLRAGRRDLVYCGPPSETEKERELKQTDSIPSNVSSKAELTHPDHVVAYTRDQPWYTVGGFLTNYYIPALKRPPVKSFVIFLSVSGVLFGLYGMYNSTLGLELSDVLPEHTPPAAFLRAREKYFSFYPMFAVLRGRTIDIPNQQKLIEEYREALGQSRYMLKADGNLQPYWMSLIRAWLVSLDEALNKEIIAGNMDALTGMPVKGKNKPAPEALIARKLVCSYGDKYNCSGRIGSVRLVSSDGIINPEGFYNYLTAWYNVDNMMYYVSQASFFPVPPSWQMGSAEVVVPPSRPLLYSQIPYYQTDLTDTPAIVKMIEEIREICDEYTEKGLPNFPTGLAFTFWEQYLSLRWNLFFAICIIAFAVFAVISLLMFNPWAAAMVMVIVVVVTIQLGGFMGLLGIKMNPISAVTLICAVGIGVEFTAHVVLAFLTSLGSVEDRLESCLQHMFVPVFHGAISTLLGIVMLVFSEFDFVIKYFFVVMSVLVVLAVFNGLCLLPVLLTLVGPEPELVPLDGSSRLPPPPPLSQQYPKKTVMKEVENGLRQRKGSEVEMLESSKSTPTQSPATQSIPISGSSARSSSSEDHEFHASLSTIAEEESSPKKK